MGSWWPVMRLRHRCHPRCLLQFEWRLGAPRRIRNLRPSAANGLAFEAQQFRQPLFEPSQSSGVIESKTLDHLAAACPFERTVERRRHRLPVRLLLAHSPSSIRRGPRYLPDREVFPPRASWRSSRRSRQSARWSRRVANKVALGARSFRFAGVHSGRRMLDSISTNWKIHDLGIVDRIAFRSQCTFSGCVCSPI
jgi:hypothetical protein